MSQGKLILIKGNQMRGGWCDALRRSQHIEEWRELSAQVVQSKHPKGGKVSQPHDRGKVSSPSERCA